MLILWILVMSIFVLLAAYRLDRRRRVGKPLPGADTMQVRGRVDELGVNDETGHSWLVLRRGKETVHVVIGEETVQPTRGIRKGQRLTVDGLRGHRVVDRLYRSPSCESVLEAFRITTAGPGPRWITPLHVVAGLGAVGLLPFVLPEESPFEKTRKTVQCPAGSTVVSGKRTPFGWVHYCIKRMTGDRHGPWTVWTNPGRLRELELYTDGVKNGRFTRWYRSGKRMHSINYVNGKRHGTETQWAEDGRLQLRRSWWRDRPHGRATGWNRQSQVVDLQSFHRGKPHGRFLQWQDCADERRRHFERSWYPKLEPFDFPCHLHVQSRTSNRIEEHFWLGAQHGPYRERWGENLKTGAFWARQRVGPWTETGAPTRFYLYGWLVENLEAFRRSDPRAPALLATVDRLRREARDVLAQREKEIDAPFEARTKRDGLFQCGGGCQGEGCRDGHGRQGRWFFPHNLAGGDVIYHDDRPVIGCIGREEAEQCVWLRMPRGNRRPPWWKMLRCLPRKVQAELGILTDDNSRWIGRTRQSSGRSKKHQH